MTEAQEQFCCELLQKATAEFDIPFEKPMLFRDGGLSVGGWSLRLFHRTKSGNISRKCSSWAFMNFCPFCGAILTEEGQKIHEARNNGKLDKEQP